MYETTYHRPASVEEAAALLAANPDAKLLAGGQTLVPTMKQRLAAPSDLVDLRHIAALRGISSEGGRIIIGAATPHAEVAGDATLRAACPGLADLAAHIGDPHVRYMGTLGGSIANNDPAADYPSAMLALGATIHTSKRDIGADDFFTGMFETALDEDEIIIAVSFAPPERAAYAKFPNPASLYAMTGVFVTKGSAGVRVAVTGAGSDGVFRQAEMEAALSADFSPAALDGITVSPEGLLEDLHASAAYRASLIKTMARRAVAAA